MISKIPSLMWRKLQHIAASRGLENCVLLLLDFGADPNSGDSEGSVPLWEAILGRHEDVIQLLVENGADLRMGDVGHFACTAAEQNSLELLEDIARYGGDITLPRCNGSTALHLAVCEGNVGMAKFLLDHGADVDKPDVNGWTPRELADQQGHEEIKALFHEKEVTRKSGQPASENAAARFIGRFSSEPSIRMAASEGNALTADDPWARNTRRRRTSNFHNSLFGIMTAAHEGEGRPSSAAPPRSSIVSTDQQPQRPICRIVVSCPQKPEATSKLVLLPSSMEELLDLGVKKFGLRPDRVLTEEGAEIDDIALIRDGDHLLLVRDGGGEAGEGHARS